MDNKIVIGVYHHADLDGICSGAIIRHFYPDAVMIGYHYGEDIGPILQAISATRAVTTTPIHLIMVDVSLPMSQMAQLTDWVDYFTWIDHHVSAANDFKEAMEKDQRLARINQVYQDGLAACELAWRHFTPKYALTPNIVALLGRYDVFRDFGQPSFEELTHPFQKCIEIDVATLDDFPMDSFLQWEGPTIEAKIERGRIALKALRQNYARAARKAYERKWRGYKAIVLNTPSREMLAIESAIQPHHEIAVMWSFDGEEYHYSLRALGDHGVDVSAIAKQYGGGGHVKAAGFKSVLNFDRLHELFEIPW